MSEDAVWKAFLKKYDRVYNEEANQAALADKEAQKQRKATRCAPPTRER